MSIKSSLIVLASILVSAGAIAQAERLGAVGNVAGVVTVTHGTTGGVATEGAPILEGMRFVTASASEVTLRFNNGCTVVLKPNQALTIDERATCRELLAAVTPVGGLVAGGGGSARAGLVAVTALTLVTFGLDRALGRSPNLSGK